MTNFSISTAPCVNFSKPHNLKTLTKKQLTENKRWRYKNAVARNVVVDNFKVTEISAAPQINPQELETRASVSVVFELK